jgi:nitrite reductase (NADH) small subunit
MSTWLKVCELNEIPRLGARVVKHGSENIAVFRNDADGVFAMLDKCPHKGGPLSQGIVAGDKVTCPLHGMNICLSDGMAVAPDEGCVTTYAVKIEGSTVYLQA